MKAIIFLVGTAFPALACINISGINLDGKPIEVGESFLGAQKAYLQPNAKQQEEDKKRWENRRGDLEKKIAAGPGVRDRSDYGGVLAMLGEFAKAKEVLEAAEAAEPGNYAVAANLGTVYELLGDDAKALEWIRKGIERNPSSHKGTEWVHVKILEAKQSISKDPKWLETNTVLGLDYGTDARPAAKSQPADTKYYLVGSLSYQLRERMQFVKAPDALVGDLLFNLGNELAVIGTAQMAKDVYELALKYGAPHKELVQQRFEFVSDVIAKAAAKKPVKRKK